MIGRLKGILLEKAPPHLLIDVAGVAYEIAAPMSTFYQLPDLGLEAILHTHLVVREDAQLLYGFFHLSERSLFRSLIKVTAIGPKLALAILSGIEPNVFVTCIMQNDTTSLVRIPGIGQKTAERLIIEMRDRLTDWQLNENLSAHATPHTLANPTDKMVQEAISALISLGYKPLEAQRAVNRLTQEYSSSEELIRHALKGMFKGVLT